MQTTKYIKRKNLNVNVNFMENILKHVLSVNIKALKMATGRLIKSAILAHYYIDLTVCA